MKPWLPAMKKIQLLEQKNLYPASPANTLSMLKPLQSPMDSRSDQLAQTQQLLEQETLRHQHIESELNQERKLAHAALEAISDAVMTTDLSGRIHYFNPVAEKMLGQNLSHAQGLPLVSILNLVDEITRDTIECPLQEMIQTGQTIQVLDQALLCTAQGQQFAIDFSVAPMQDSQGYVIGAVLVFRDVTSTRRLAQQLSWQASHDSLTGLFNRHKFEDTVITTIRDAQAGNQHVLCYLDLDQFKIVNDTCGHIAGDQLLLTLSEILSSEIRSSDMLARLGGDEFGILFYQCSLGQANTIVERIHGQLQNFRFLWQGQTFSVSASFGLVQIDETSQSLTQILAAADAACYAAKEAGRNRIHLYCIDDDELTRQRRERLWISRINQAIEEDRFQLYAQEIAPLDPPTPDYTRHVEILLRMVDRNGELIPPGCFIPAAERYGLMTELDRVVIKTFFESYAKACMTLSGTPLDNCMYAINLSARSLNDEQFIDFVKAQFKVHRVPPEIICFEITETAAISNLTKASQLIQELKLMGCRFALDDFGSGMNCFAYLKQLTIDYLKIDGSFIKNITQEPIDKELVICMNRIAHVLGAKTVAEWVETDETFQTLREIGIDYGQGFGISRPRPLEFAPLIVKE
jgi:diguanylate cyclase (GGDEF)-like protein/PAS domain S-box-containing protein